MHTLRARFDPWGIAGGKDYTSVAFEVPAAWATVIDGGSGRLLALIEAQYLNLVRTAAVTAVATDLLAPSEPAVLAHFGAGKISEPLVRAILHVRPSIRSVLLVRRSRERGAPAWLTELGPGIRGELVTAEEAVARAELATTATNSTQPVIPEGASLPRLRHLNLVGSNHLKRREIGADLALRCLPAEGGLLVADDPEQAAEEAGDFAPLVDAGRLDWKAVPSLAQLLRGNAPRAEARAAALTAFKSVGIGLMDLLVAGSLLRRLGALRPPERSRPEGDPP
jgi:ornithine cyclodeaminase